MKNIIRKLIKRIRKIFLMPKKLKEFLIWNMKVYYQRTNYIGNDTVILIIIATVNRYSKCNQHTWINSKIGKNLSFRR